MSDIIQDKDYTKRVVEAKEVTNPYLIYEMTIRGAIVSNNLKKTCLQGLYRERG